MLRWFVVVPFLISCATSQSVVCGDRLCPLNTICDDLHNACVTPEQVTACNGSAEGAECHTGIINGVCDGGFCIDAQCGNEIVEPGELCDDGNFVNGDRCGLNCQSDETCGNTLTDFEIGETCDDGDHDDHDGCDATCNAEVPSWERVPNRWLPRAGHVSVVDTVGNFLHVVGGFDADDLDWRFKGKLWASSPGIPARAFASAAFDTKRSRIVLYGGLSGDMVLDETWEFDPVLDMWVKANPASSPPPRFGSAMAYDPIRKVVVLVGGSFNPSSDLWEYDGITWTSRILSNAPPARVYASLVWDPSRLRMVMYGGADGGGTTFDDTWEIDIASNAWVAGPVTPTKPQARYAASVAWHPGLGALVLFGGYSIAGRKADLWKYDATGWHALVASGGPSPRYLATLTTTDTGVQLVGGDTADGTSDEVWTLDPALAWGLATPRFRPSPRMSPIAYDEDRQQVVLFDGWLDTSEAQETWTYDHGTWRSLGRLTPIPPARALHSMVFDRTRHAVVMFGGRDLNGRLDQCLGNDLPNEYFYCDDTWSWDGTMWTRVGTDLDPHPPSRLNAAMAFHAKDGVTILFGGTPSSGVKLDDTWKLDASGWSVVETPTHPAGQFRPTLGYDETGERIVLVDTAGATWAYGNGAWAIVGTTPELANRESATLVFDRGRGRLMLFGGDVNSVAIDDAWELVGDAWQPIVVAGMSPPRRLRAGVAYVPEESSILLFGGQRNAGFYDDSWLFQYRVATN